MSGPGSRVGRSRRSRLGLAVLLAATVLGGAAACKAPTSTAIPAASAPPPESGYFQLRGEGSWADLPSGSDCTARIHASTWEPRPINSSRNSVMPDPEAVHRALATRPRAHMGAYDERWDTWLLPRVDGQFVGATDEIFQWAACKWGLSDNLLRAIAVRESGWHQYSTYRSGRCVPNWGCGDEVTDPQPATATFCALIGRYGYDYEQDYGTAMCPRTYSIVGIMAWHAPEWGRMPGNQNGTFPFSRDSTAFAVDYLGASLRGCLEGWQVWLDHTGTQTYGAGHIWGCVGSWYSGGWHDPRANEYIAKVRSELQNRTWLDVGWPMVEPACTPDYGCPGGEHLVLPDR